MEDFDKPELVAQLAKATNYFTMNLLKALPQRDNTFFSPLSIMSALGMVYFGAGGSTAEELKTGLGFEHAKLIENDDTQHAFKEMKKILSCPSQDVTLNVANRVITANQFHIFEEYITLIREYFEIELDQMDFSSKGEDAKNDVNRWVNEKTNGKIPAMLNKAPDPNTAMLLLNAVYFNAPWKNRFDPVSTRRDTFYNFGTKATSFMMMLTKMDANYAHIDELSCEVLELPYSGDRLSMLFILPDALDGLEALEQKLTSEKLQVIVDSLLMTPSVYIKIPTFEMQQGYNLETILSKLGIKKAFTPSEADFSGICSGNIHISKVLHKAFVGIDEKGTEATAATICQSGYISGAGFQKPAIFFYANHPFLFVIRDKTTGLMLFLGRAWCLSNEREGKMSCLASETNSLTNNKKKRIRCTCC